MPDEFASGSNTGFFKKKTSVQVKVFLITIRDCRCREKDFFGEGGKVEHA